MSADIVVTVAAGLVLIVAVVGTVFPIVPGSPLAIVTLVVWAWVMGSTAAWVAAGVGSALAAAGWATSFVLTGRKVRQHQIPRGSIAVAVVCGVAGLFLVPFFGLLIGFAAGLLVSEYARRRDFRTALHSSGEALKAAGIGVLVEFAMVGLAGSIWTVGVIVHFAMR